MSATKKTAKAAKTPKMTPEGMTEGLEKMTKSLEDATAFSKDTYEAVVESATTFAKGVEGIVAEQTEFAKDAMEDTQDKMKAFASTRNPQDFFEAQTEFMKSAFETNLSQMTKVSDMWMATTKDAVNPLSKRYSAMVEMVQGYRL